MILKIVIGVLVIALIIVVLWALSIKESMKVLLRERENDGK